MIRIVQEKTGAALSIPLHSALLAAIKAMPARGVTLIGDANGRPIKRATLTLIMRKAAASADLPAHCVAHGLRKAIMRRLAEHGSSAKEIAAISGHRSLRGDRMWHRGSRSSQVIESGNGQAQGQQKANMKCLTSPGKVSTPSINSKKPAIPPSVTLTARYQEFFGNQRDEVSTPRNSVD